VNYCLKTRIVTHLQDFPVKTSSLWIFALDACERLGLSHRADYEADRDVSGCQVVIHDHNPRPDWVIGDSVKQKQETLL
jgi:hypothetical protein